MSDEAAAHGSDIAADDINIQPSAVALLDVLGFKNLERSSAAKAMRSARRMIVELTKWMNDENFNYIYGLGGKPNVTSSWFSDTICIVVQPAKEKLLQRDESKTMPSLLAVAATSVGYLVRQAAVAEVPLAFRGVIAVGEMAVVDENIYVGAPIAEASALYEKADGAFVWLSPAAYQIRMPHWPGVNTHRPLIEYEVPLKDGRTVHTKVVNPFIDMLPTAQPGIDVRNGIVGTMGSDLLDVTIKRQNTIDFLKEVADTELPRAPRGTEGGK